MADSAGILPNATLPTGQFSPNGGLPASTPSSTPTLGSNTPVSPIAGAAAAATIKNAADPNNLGILNNYTPQAELNTLNGVTPASPFNNGTPKVTSPSGAPVGDQSLVDFNPNKTGPTSVAPNAMVGGPTTPPAPISAPVVPRVFSDTENQQLAQAAQRQANGTATPADLANLKTAQAQGWTAPAPTNPQGLTADQMTKFANGQIDKNGNPITAPVAPTPPTPPDYTSKIQALISGGYDNVSNIASALGISTADAQSTINGSEDLSYQLRMNNLMNDNSTALANAKKNLDNISNGIFTLSPQESSTIQATKDLYTQMETDQARINAAYEGGVATNEARSGREEFNNTVSSGIMKGAVQIGLEKIQTLENTAITKVNDLQMAFQDKRYTAAKDIYDGLQKDLQDKTTAIQNLHDDVLKQAQDVRAATAAADQHIASVNNNMKVTQEVAKTTADNAADSVISQLTGDPTKDSGIISSAAKLLGIDPGVLQTSITNRRLAIQKELLAQGQTQFDMSKPYPVGESTDAMGNKITVYGVYDPTNPNGYRIVQSPDLSGADGGNTGGGGTGDSTANIINASGGIKWTGAPWQTALGGTDSGMKASDGGTFVKWPDLATAQKAQAQLFTSDTYKNLTLDQALAKWSNNGYKSADLAKYGLDTSTIKGTTKVGDLTPDQVTQVLNAQRGKEGYVSNLGNTNSGFNSQTGIYEGPSVAKGNNYSDIQQFLSTGPALAVKGGAHYDQGTLFNSAILSMLGAPDSAIGGMGSMQGRAAIGNKVAALGQALGISAQDMATAKTEYKSLTAAQVKITTQATFVNAYANTALDNMKLITDFVNSPEGSQVMQGNSKFVNNYAQWAQGNFTPAGPLAKLETYIYTASREYAKVTSGGATSAQGLTDSAQAEASKLLSASQSPAQLKAAIEAMTQDMNNVKGELNKSVQQLPNSIANIITSLQASQGDSGNSSSNNNQSVQFKDPKTGEIRSFTGLTPDDIKNAISQGYQQIQ